jgi:hypothetical protein
MKRLRRAEVVCWTIFALSAALLTAGFFALRVMRVPQDAAMLFGTFTAHRTGTVLACLLALLLSFRPSQRGFWISLLLSFLALATATGDWLASTLPARRQSMAGLSVFLIPGGFSQCRSRWPWWL